MILVATSNLPSQKILITWTKNFIYGLLILWVCGVGPLIYVESFSSHHGVQAYRIAILEKPGRSTRLPSDLREILARRPGYEPAGPLTPQPQLIRVYHFTAPGFFLSAFRDGYVPPVKVTVYDNLLPWGRVSTTVLIGSSVRLPPPEKPPPFLWG